MVQRQNLGRWASVVCALTINLCAAAPPDDGLTVGGGAGYGQYSYSSGGCGAPEYRNEANDLRAHARAQLHSRKDHWSVTLEGSYGQGEVVNSVLVDPGDDGAAPAQDAEQLGATKRSYAATLRGGGHWAYGGAELGAAFTGGNFYFEAADDLSPRFAISASGWAGVPEYVYAWGAVTAAPLTPGWAPIALGIGHKGEHVRARLGAGVGSGPRTHYLGLLDVKLPFEQPVWLGVGAHSDLDATHGGLLTIEVPLKID